MLHTYLSPFYIVVCDCLCDHECLIVNVLGLYKITSHPTVQSEGPKLNILYESEAL